MVMTTDNSSKSTGLVGSVNPFDEELSSRTEPAYDHTLLFSNDVST